MAEETPTKSEPQDAAKTVEVKPETAKAVEAKPEAAQPAKDKASAAKTAKDKPPAAKAKAKKPKLEDKPFNEFIEQDFIPTLTTALTKEGLEVDIVFTQAGLPFAADNASEKCWQVIGKWLQGQRQFNLYFLEESITGKKAFAASTAGTPPSTLESFMIDERKVTLDLLVLYVLQRLNGQKWLIGN